MRLGSGRFTHARDVDSQSRAVIDETVAICHHLSYARNNDELQLKLSSFSHAAEVLPGWYENVWLRWDEDPDMRDLHPTHPSCYARAIEQPTDLLPPGLRGMARVEQGAPGRKRPVIILCVEPEGYAHAGAIADLADAVEYGMRSLGLDVDRRVRPGPSSHLHVVVGAHLLTMSRQSVPSDAILFNTEQIARSRAEWMPAYLDLLFRHSVWDYSEANVAALRALGHGDVAHVPVGYAPKLTRIAQTVEDIDVVFAGSISPRRERVLDGLRANGLSVRSLFGTYGAERDAYYARARVVLNMHCYEGSPFEIVRVSYLLANRRFVVSELSPNDVDEEAFADGMVVTAYEGLVAACVRYVREPDERRRIAAIGFERISARPMAHAIGDALARVGGLGTAVE
jgi:hypothetical protein